LPSLGGVACRSGDEDGISSTSCGVARVVRSGVGFSIALGRGEGVAGGVRHASAGSGSRRGLASGGCDGVLGGSRGDLGVDFDVGVALDGLAFSCCVAARTSLKGIVKPASSSHIDMHIPTRGLFLLFLLCELDAFRPRSELLDRCRIGSPLPLVHRLYFMFPLMVEDVRIKLVRILDIAFAPGLPRVVHRPRPQFVFLHARSGRDKRGRGWTYVGDQALEDFVAAAALFGRTVGREVLY